jgi:hypothetical protein
MSVTVVVVVVVVKGVLVDVISSRGMRPWRVVVRVCKKTVDESLSYKEITEGIQSTINSNVRSNAGSCYETLCGL